jgi:multicomponent Na+:H+ antiporter subunit E
MKNRFWITLFLLLTWCGFSNSFTLITISAGLFFAVVINLLVLPKSLDFELDVVQLILLVGLVIIELFRSSLQVAWDILTPSSKSQSQLIKFPIYCQHPAQISLLMSLISLTPGTIAVDVSQDNKILVVHVMFYQHVKHILAFIKEDLEPKIMRVIKYDSAK